MNDFEIINELIEFTKYSFNELKNIINPHHNTILIIDYEDSYCKMGGYCVINYEIHIIIYNIYEYCNFDIELTKYGIVKIIIHELFHSYQSFLPILYSNNNEYKQDVENQVEYMTFDFLLNNLEFIQDKFNLEFNKDYIIECVNNLSKNEYTNLNQDLSQYYFNFIMESLHIINIDKLPNIYIYYIDNIMNEKYNNIYYIINNNEFIIKKNNIYNNNILEITDIYKYFYKHRDLINSKHDINYNYKNINIIEKDDTITIKIDLDYSINIINRKKKIINRK